MKQKMNLKSGMFNGLPAYACALLLLAAGWYTVARIRRRERKTSPRTPDSAEN